MFLKFLSTAELDFNSCFKTGMKKLSKLSKFDRFFTLFWLLGPFIFLIERDPADLWLTIICIAFLYRSIKNSDWSWSKQLWFRLALGVWILSIISSALSPEALFSFQQGFVWIRFPLIAVATQVWIAKDRDIRVLMLISTLVGMLVICLILTLEILIEPKARLTWPYGDTMTGAYLSKVSLPIFCILIAISTSRAKMISLFFGSIALSTLAFSILAGERINFLIRLCGGFLATFSWKPRLLPLLVFFSLECFAIFFVLNRKTDVYSRFTTDLVEIIVHIDDKNGHWGAWRGGIQQGFETPMLGIGPSGTRNNCKHLIDSDLEWLPGKNVCSNHPHNFYIQLLAELGVLGLLLGSGMFLSIILVCWKAKQKNPECPMASTAFIIPLALFFPLQQFGSFFSQWGNIFIWFSIGFALSQFQNLEDKKEN